MRDATVLGAVLVFVVAVGTVAPATAGATSAGAGIAASADAGATQGLECGYPMSSTDATGTEVSLDEEPERVVTLNPSAAQTLWEFGASEKVVGLTGNALYLDGADEKTVVAEGFEYDVETIIDLEPDLVLAPNATPKETVRALRNNGQTVYHFEEAGDFEDVYAKTELIGRLAGECSAASATVADMRERVEAIREAVSDEQHPGSMYVFFGFTAGDDTFIDAVLETAGTTNVAAEVGITRYAEVNDEVIANNSERIEWLVLNSDTESHPSGGVYEGTVAMQEGQTVVLNIHYLNQPAPRTVLALENLTRAVHPEAYEEAQAALASTPTPTATATPTQAGDGTGTAAPTASTPTATATATAAATPAGTGTSTATPADTAAGGPGFGLAAGVLALLAVALFGRRR